MEQTDKKNEEVATILKEEEVLRLREAELVFGDITAISV